MQDEHQVPEQSLSELLQIRRDKLSALQEAGRDPFRETRFDRTASSAEILGDFDGFENKTDIQSLHITNR